MKLKKENFHMYYDSGIGNPFDTQEAINFCINYQDLFTREVKQQDEFCWICDEEGLDCYYIFDLDTDSNIELFKKHFSNAENILEEFEDIESIGYGVCNTCEKWVVTH